MRNKSTIKKYAASAVLFLLMFFPLTPPGAGSQSTQDAAPQSTGGDPAVADYAGIGAADLAARGNYLTVKIAVAGPGDEIYFWWGHIGLVIEDALTGTNMFYDWGVFSFDKENFYMDFALGRPWYSCAATPADYNTAHFIATNRDLTLYTLDLPPEAKTELLLFATHTVLPENRDYRYHHFYDNCATRVRDIIDRAVGGAFKETYGEAPGRFTLRGHVRRHTWFSAFWDWFTSFLMGQGIDRPTTVWEEMFLPSEIALRAMEFRYTDPSGAERKLVSNVEVVNSSIGRPGTAEIPPRHWYRELIAGLCAAAFFAVVRWKKARRLSGAAQAALGLFFGLAGVLLFFMSFFTSHDYTWHNSTVLFIHPLVLAALPLGLIAAFSGKEAARARAEKLLRILWTAVFAGGVVTIVMRLFPAFYQQNQPTQAIVLPFAFVLSVIPELLRQALVRLRQSRRSPS
jgi:hypothetical protein